MSVAPWLRREIEAVIWDDDRPRRELRPPVVVEDEEGLVPRPRDDRTGPFMFAILTVLHDSPGATTRDIYLFLRRRRVAVAKLQKDALAGIRDALHRLEARGLVRSSPVRPRDRDRVGGSALWEAA